MRKSLTKVAKSGIISARKESKTGKKRADGEKHVQKKHI
jgi:hypothetical protein